MAATTAPHELSIAIPRPGDDQPSHPAALAGVASASAPGGDNDEEAWKTAQKWLNRFIRAVAFVERTGNAVGTLAFTWATVVVLGGFSTDLRDDFWVFSRENRSDDKLLFKTSGGIRVLKLSSTLELLYFLNAVIVMLCLSVVLLVVLEHVFPKRRYMPLLLAALLVLLAKFPVTSLLKRANRPGSGRRVVAVLRLTPVAAIVALGCSLALDGAPPVTVVASVTLLFIMSTQCQQLIAVREKINRPAPQRPTAAPPPSLAQRARLRLRLRLLPKLTNTLLVVYPPFIVSFLTATFGYLGLYVVFTAVALGNFQIPVAVARVAISSARLAGRVNRVSTSNVNLVPSLKIFYGLVLAQGALYILACLMDPFSVVLRRWLARRCKLGTRSVDLYHEHAYDACMEDGLLAMEDANIVSFAVDSLSSGEPSRSREKVLAGVTVLHCFLRQGGSKARLASSKITTSTNAVVTLIRMLGWGAEEDRQIRLFAAKVIGEIAGELRIARFPGTVQLISSLLDAPSYSKKEQDSGGSTHTEAAAGNVNTDSTCCCCFRKPSCPRRIKNLCAAPDEEPLDDDEDALPIMGMLILEKLAYDPENCAEIWRATNLISKVIGFIACSSNDDDAAAQRNRRPITTSSLKLVAKLAGAKGEIGVALRRKISDHPFLLSSLAGVLEDDGAGTEQWAPAMDILAKLCINADTRQEVGEIGAIITKLVREFFPSRRDQQRSSTQDDRQLRLVAGEALATLAMESHGNCSAILKEKGYDLVNHLKNMLSARDEDGCRCAANLLQNLCAHSGDELRQIGSSTFKVVLEKILDTKGKQLEVLIGLASQIRNAIPACFKDALESLADNAAEALVEKLVDTLNSSKKPSPEYPRMRRVIVELAISTVETRTRYGYAAEFRKKGMVEALSKVERTPSKVERYRLFFGDAGVVLERGLPLPDLVATAKGLIETASPGV
uniref:Uncharacterized protein n=1 Tax=Oryza punctata TaxID=4537 RepID=A0A0E0JL86_ORYPU